VVQVFLKGQVYMQRVYVVNVYNGRMSETLPVRMIQDTNCILDVYQTIPQRRKMPTRNEVIFGHGHFHIRINLELNEFAFRKSIRKLINFI
jgi:hypothetical protein